MAKRAIAGTVFLTVDGTQYQLGGTLTYSPDLTEREGMVGLSGPAGYTEKPRIPFIEGEFFTTSDLSLKAISEICDATVTAQLNNGKTITLRNAWVSGAREASGSDGTVTIRFEGTDSLELSNG